MIRFQRPSVFAVLLTLFGVGVFCALGVWQLRRADYTEMVLARFHHAAVAPLVPLGTAIADPHRGDYPHVEVAGHFDVHRVYFLDDQMREGRLGVMVFVPFQPVDADRTLLVNLGFLAKMGPDATRLPDLPPIPQEEVRLEGIYAPPPLPGLKLGGNPLVREKTWPKLVTFIDIGQIAADLHREIYPRVLLLDPDPRGAYIRMWTANVMLPARHRAYALQWFTFAAAAIVIFLVLHRVKPAPATHQDEEP
ncbi:MAG: SURF1 family protein [Rhodanobacteraceae bacterium]